MYQMIWPKMFLLLFVLVLWEWRPRVISRNNSRFLSTNLGQTMSRWCLILIWWDHAFSKLERIYVNTDALRKLHTINNTPNTLKHTFIELFVSNIDRRRFFCDFRTNEFNLISLLFVVHEKVPDCYALHGSIYRQFFQLFWDLYFIWRKRIYFIGRR